jgi:predicted transcriptional regulator
MKDKELAIGVINKLPEDTSMEEIAEELQIMAAIEKAKADVKAGRVKSHEAVTRLVETWN